ncbi:unnamed protein product [Ixodes persulcatus]
MSWLCGSAGSGIRSCGCTIHRHDFSNGGGWHVINAKFSSRQSTDDRPQSNDNTSHLY